MRIHSHHIFSSKDPEFAYVDVKKTGTHQAHVDIYNSLTLEKQQKTNDVAKTVNEDTGGGYGGLRDYIQPVHTNKTHLTDDDVNLRVSSVPQSDTVTGTEDYMSGYLSQNLCDSTSASDNNNELIVGDKGYIADLGNPRYVDFRSPPSDSECNEDDKDDYIIEESYL